MDEVDGVHDLGGMQDFGPVLVERSEPVFHASWEARVFGIGGIVTLQGLANTNKVRHAIERMDPSHYLGSPYFEHWLTAFATLLVEQGVLTREELEARAGVPFPLSRPSQAPPWPRAAAGDGHSRFAVGDRVRVAGGDSPAPPGVAAAGALEALRTEEGLVAPEFIDAIVSAYANDIGPMNGARVVARAWVDGEYRDRLLGDGTAAIAELGFGGPEGEHIVVVENTADVHNVIVCTLCSCYPWPVLGLPPNWYKSPPYRSRMVREPRAVLAEMGCDVPDDVEIRVWDSSAEVRYLVLTARPPGTDGASEDELAAMVTRDAMIGVAR